MVRRLDKHENTEIIKKLASVSEAQRDEAMKQINDLLMIRSFETGYARMYFENVSDTGIRIIDPSHELYTVVDDDKPAVMYHIQPDVDLDPSLGEKAVVVNPYAGVRKKRFSGTRFTETFDTLSTNKFYQNVNALYTYPYDIVEYFENRSTRILLDLEDKLFFNMINELLSLNSSALSSMNVYAIAGDSFTVQHFSHFRDFHNRKQVPASRILTHYSQFNEVERTGALSIEKLGYDGIMGNLKMDNGLYKMSPIILNTEKYCYYSFDIDNKSNKAESEQFFIDLDVFTKYTAASSYAKAIAATSSDAALCADFDYLFNYLEGMGYKYTGLYGTANEADGIAIESNDATKWIGLSGAIEADGSGDKKILGKKLYRSYILPQQQYFGHFDLFLKDAETIVEKHQKFLHFHTEEELIMTAKNPYAATVMDVWS